MSTARHSRAQLRTNVRTRRRATSRQVVCEVECVILA